jgi:hypothetical protein
VAEAHAKIQNMPEWMAQSMQSSTQEIYHAKVSPEMIGSSFAHLALCSMFMSSSLIFGVVTMHGQIQTFRPNPLDTSLSHDHILVIFAVDQESANELVVQISMVITILGETANAEEALVSIQASEETGSALRDRNKDHLSQLLIVFQEMQLNLHQRQQHTHPPFSVLDSAERTGNGKGIKQNYNDHEALPKKSAQPSSASRLLRSNTFTSAVSESFLPPSRRGSIAAQEHAAASPSLRPGVSPSHTSSPLLRAATFIGKAVDESSNASPLRRLLVRQDSHSSRDRRDSDSSAALSSISHSTGGAQVCAGAALSLYSCSFSVFDVVSLCASAGQVSVEVYGAAWAFGASKNR